MRVASAVLCALLTLSGLGAQDPPAGQQLPKPTFRVGVNQVYLSVTAREQTGGFVPNLKKEDFKIYEDGVEQQILNFSTGSAPVKVALLVDASGSTQRMQSAFQRAALKFVSRLDAEDEVAIITFNDKCRLILDWTKDAAKIESKLRSIWAKGATVVHDALYVTYDDLFKNLTDRRAIILLTDGIDTGSLTTANQVMALAQRSEATVYIVSLFEAAWQTAIEIRALALQQLRPVPPWLTEAALMRSKEFLERLAQTTGGRVFNARELNFEGIYEEVAAELKNRYYLSYSPTNKRRDGTWRKVDIELAKMGMVVRTRPGYYASEDVPVAGN